MHLMVYSAYYLGCMVGSISALFAEWSITERNVTTFRYCCLGFFLAWNPLFCFRYRCCHFPGCGKYIFSQLQTCTALVLFGGYTECSSSPNLVIFNNFLVFNFAFFSFWAIIFFSLDKYSLIFDVVLHYQLDALKIPKMV